MDNINDYYLSIIAGLISFFSPCILPLFPIYLATLDSSIDGENKNSVQLLKKSLLFIFSFCLVFILLGLTATSVGIFLNINRFYLLKISGSLIIIFGLINLFSSKIQIFSQNYSLINSTSAKPIMLGLCFGLAWTPCVGPILGTIITYSSVEKDYLHSLLMLAMYSAGLGAPFILGSLGLKRVFISFKNNRIFNKFYTPLMGITLILFGYLVYTNKIYILTIYVQNILKIME